MGRCSQERNVCQVKLPLLWSVQWCPALFLHCRFGLFMAKVKGEEWKLNAPVWRYMVVIFDCRAVLYGYLQRSQHVMLQRFDRDWLHYSMVPLCTHTGNKRFYPSQFYWISIVVGSHPLVHPSIAADIILSNVEVVATFNLRSVYLGI